MYAVDLAKAASGTIEAVPFYNALLREKFSGCPVVFLALTLRGRKKGSSQ